MELVQPEVVVTLGNVPLKALSGKRVVIGDVPSVRIDAMPYGGVKHSGIGREGVRYAIEEMTEPRLLLVRD